MYSIRRPGKPAFWDAGLRVPEYTSLEVRNKLRAVSDGADNRSFFRYVLSLLESLVPLAADTFSTRRTFTISVSNAWT